MAKLPLKPCLHAGCPELVCGKAYCKKHTPQKVPRQISREWHRMYKDERWNSLRTNQLLKEPYCCECAKKKIRTPATDVDHILPHRGDWGRSLDANNLQSLCHSCHSVKTVKERNELKNILKENQRKVL